jgi:hypothetical protein
MLNLSLRHVWIIAFVSVAFGFAWMFRYETTPKPIGYLIHDRWTGETKTCVGMVTEYSRC